MNIFKVLKLQWSIKQLKKVNQVMLAQGNWMIRPLNKLINNKVRLLFSQKYLLYTNVTISVGLSTFGDVSMQSYQGYKKQQLHFNRQRSLHVAASGLIIGAFCHYWYLYLDKWLPGRTIRIVMKKLLVDQVICSPIYIGMFFLTTCTLEKKSWEETKTESLEKGAMIYMAEWVVWPPAQIINFCFLPTKFRVLYDSVISLGFDCYFSKVKYDLDEDATKNDR